MSAKALCSTIALALGFSLLAACSPATPDPKNPAASDANASSEPTVAVVHPVRASLSHNISLTAEFRPYQEIDVHAKVSGYVQKINVDVGDHVKTGDVLAVLEIPELEEDQKKADAAVQTAQQEVQSAQAASEDSNKICQRLQNAAKQAPGLIAQQDLDTASDKARGNAANLQAAQQRVAEAQAEADRMRAMLAYSRITAPFDGVITKRYADTGALIQAGTSSSTQSMPVVRLAELQRLRLDFPVPESAVSDIHIGDHVQVHVEALNRTFDAPVTRFADMVDSATRTMLTELEVDNSDFLYTPGMYATAKLMLSEKKDALAIPIQCVSTGDNPTVLVLNDEHKVEERSVAVGIETATMAEILSGLNDQDQVVMGSRSSAPLGEVALAKPMDGGKL